MDHGGQRIPIESFAVSVYVARRTEQGPLWLLMRRREDGRGYGGVWQQVTGSLEAGEKPDQAAVREVKEETGLEVVRLYSADTLESFFEPSTQSIWVNPVFLAIVAGQVVTLSDEHDDHAWLTTAEAIERAPFRQQRDNLAILEEDFFRREPCEYLRMR
jgi:8-oxo-dGTP pyrophosphatase MutT (NUDIX family)